MRWVRAAGWFTAFIAVAAWAEITERLRRR